MPKKKSAPINLNKKCRCGSGKKYGLCHFKADREKAHQELIHQANFPSGLYPGFVSAKWGVAKRGYMKWAEVMARQKKKKSK